MGYRIEYDRNTNKYEVEEIHPFRFPIFVAISFMLFLVVISFFWPEGTEIMQEILIPGDNEVTLVALDLMISELRSGSTFEDAASTFCYEIINSAKNTY